MSGVFMTIEGPDGSGKTTMISQLIPLLESSLTVPLIVTREPGGNLIAEKIRQIILDPSHTKMDGRTEALLYAASRRQHLVETILPNLERDTFVLCDRFVDSSIAYQGFARNIGQAGIKAINDFATDGIEPELTLLLSVPAEVGIKRIEDSRHERQFDRLDQETIAFHKQVYSGYQYLLEQYPERIQEIDGQQSRETVVNEAFTKIKQAFPTYFKEAHS